MSVVAGCTLFNGVLLAADSRITFSWPDGRVQYADVAQKLFPVAPGTALGFVSADVRLTSLMLRALLSEVGHRRRTDPMSLLQWMPRLFRRAAAVWQRRYGQLPYTAFLGASVLRGRPNVVRRGDVVDLVNYFAFSNPPIRRNWLPPILIPILETPPTTTHIRLQGTTMGTLYTMEPPRFEPQYRPALRFTAIGSGRGVIDDIHRVRDWIFAGDVGNRFVEASSFVSSIERFAIEHGIPGVGGLYPLLRVDGNLGGDMIEGWGFTRETPVGGTRIQLSLENGQWIQRNLSTGRQIALVPPWRVEQFRDSGVFDDLDNAYREMQQRTE